MSWENILKNAVATTANAQMQVDDDYSDLEEEYREDCKEKFLKFGTKLAEMDNALGRMIETNTLYAEKKDVGKPIPTGEYAVNFDGKLGIHNSEYKLDGWEEDATKRRFTGFRVKLKIEHIADMPDELYCRAIELLKQAEFKGLLSTLFGSHTSERIDIGGRPYRIYIDKYLEGNDDGDLVNSTVGFTIGISDNDPNTSANEIYFSIHSQKMFTFTKEQGEQMYNKVMQIWGV